MTSTETLAEIRTLLGRLSEADRYKLIAEVADMNRAEREAVDDEDIEDYYED